MTNTTSDKDTAGTTGVTGVTGTAGAAAAASARARILVLGAGGFVGRHVFAGLSGAAGMSAVATTRSGRLPPGAPAGATAIALDAADPTALRAVLATGFDGVVDCTAGSPQAMRTQAQVLHDTWQALPTPPRLVYLSSMAVYGAFEGAATEDTPLDTAASEDSYGGAKVAAEALLLRATPHVVVLRPGCIYGGGSPQWSTRIARLLRERRIGDLGADGDGICNAVHVVDVARAVAAALTTPGIAGEVFNLAMAPPPTWNGYFLAYAKALGAVPLQRIGARRLKIETKLLAPVLKIAEIVGKKAGLGADRFPPPIPPSLLRLWRQEIRLEAGKAQRVLGVTWMGLEEGLSSAARSPG